MPQLSAPPALIAIDWGNSSFRAWAVDENGLVLAHRRLDIGILKVQSGLFAGTMQSVISGWRMGVPVPVLLSGMIGSRQGWVEVPYLFCPMATSRLAQNLYPVPNETNVFIVPGLALQDNGRRDVMRGEETQIVGLLPDISGTIVLPGTHSKWARVNGETVESFRTFMTGELFGALKNHTILGRGMIDAPHFERDAFMRGVVNVRENSIGMLSQLFSVRALGLFGDVKDYELADYLSGLLIGAEVKDAATEMIAGDVALVGSDQLVERYRVALEVFGIRPTTHGEDTSLRGLMALARQAGLMK